MSDQPAKSKPAADRLWTEDAIALLRQLWIDEEKGATMVAQILSERLKASVSRNMVLGKVHRLGWKRPEKPKPAAAAPPAPAQEPAASVMDLPFVAPVPPPAAPELDGPVLPGIRLPDIGLFQCRWPLGEPTSPDFRFCGEPFDPANTYSWCEKHLAIGTDQRSAAQSRRDRERAKAMVAGRNRTAA